MDFIKMCLQLISMVLSYFVQILNWKVSLINIPDQLIIKFLDLINKVFGVRTISLFQLNQLILYLFSVLLHILEKLLVHIEAFKSIFHLCGKHIILIIDFLLKQSTIWIKITHFLVNFLKNV